MKSRAEHRARRAAGRQPGQHRLLTAVSLVAASMLIAVAGCSGGLRAVAGPSTVVLASNSYLADIVKNVAGDAVQVESLMGVGVDPHSFEPTPEDAKLIAGSRLIVIDVTGLTPGVDSMIKGTAQPGTTVLQAARGIPGRHDNGEDQSAVDPHFWLDPNNVITYVKNIREALTAIDPVHAAQFASNAARYTRQLQQLDQWVRTQVATIPVGRRLLVTNHETFGYFANRYGFKVVGTVFKSLGSEGAASAKQTAELIRTIRSTGAPAVFLEAGSNAELADEVARETGAKVVEN